MSNLLSLRTWGKLREECGIWVGKGYSRHMLERICLTCSWNDANVTIIRGRMHGWKRMGTHVGGPGQAWSLYSVIVWGAWEAVGATWVHSLFCHQSYLLKNVSCVMLTPFLKATEPFNCHVLLWNKGFLMLMRPLDRQQPTVLLWKH